MRQYVNLYFSRIAYICKDAIGVFSFRSGSFCRNQDVWTCQGHILKREVSAVIHDGIFKHDTRFHERHRIKFIKGNYGSFFKTPHVNLWAPYALALRSYSGHSRNRQIFQTGINTRFFPGTAKRTHRLGVFGTSRKHHKEGKRHYQTERRPNKITQQRVSNCLFHDIILLTFFV